MNLDFRALRKADPARRRELLAQAFPQMQDDLAVLGGMDALAETMVEQALGTIPVPLGLAGGFLINGQSLVLPLATEEPSVIAAATFAATRLARHGGLSASADEPIMSAQVFVDGFPDDASRDKAIAALDAARAELRKAVEPHLASMARRGGGWRDLRIVPLDDPDCLKIELDINVCDAMGANLLNTCAEALREPVVACTGRPVLMAILSNAARARLARASFRIPVADLARAGFDGPEAGQRIVSAARMASLDPDRAITHNKGIMNGISALMLATCNDTRATEAAAHAWACRDGRYRPLSDYRIVAGDEGDYLEGRIELPLACGTVGGATACHPAARAALTILGNPGARELARIAAALGLAQNFAALAALSAEGIQQGHMRLHQRRLNQ